MTNQEFSNEFDVLYNNITSNQAPGLDEYEKSVFLTNAQDDVIKSYFNPKSNKVQDGFDDTPRRQVDFSMILRTLSFVATDSSKPVFDNREQVALFKLKESNKAAKILMFINESVTVQRDSKDIRLTVVPISYQDYDRLMSKPFKRPLKNQAWRMLVTDDEGNSCSEITIGSTDILREYRIRYIRRPRPIVLGDLEGLSIDGETKNSECELDPILHKEILQRAVELAKAAYAGDLTSTVALGLSSKTDIGMLTGGGK